MHRFVHRILRSFLISMAPLTLTAGSCLGEPQDAAKDKKMAEIRMRAEQGYPQQQIELAAAYLTGRGVPQDPVQAAYWYRKAADSGNPEAQNQIGYFYQVGIGMPVDAERAVHWFQLASAGGMAWAKVNLGVSFLNGWGVGKNAAMAQQLFKAAVDKGAGLGATYLGIMNYFGKGVAVDKAAAERWFETGVKLHDPEAAFDLAILICNGDGERHDVRRAVELLRMSAGKGYVPAKHSLGLLLVNHPELAQTGQEARLALQEASNGGNWKSSVLLGIMARDGKGGIADPAQAYYYFHLGGLQGGVEGKHAVGPDVNALRRKLSGEQQAAAEAQAEAWFQQHPLPLMFLYREGESDRNFPLLAVAAPAARP